MKKKGKLTGKHTSGQAAPQAPGGSVPPPFGPRSMEKMMRDLTKLLEEQEGASDAAHAALDEALAYNEHVPTYLLGKKKLPKQLPAYRGFGDEREAVDYASTGIMHWRRTYGALRWLRKQVSVL